MAIDVKDDGNGKSALDDAAVVKRYKKAFRESDPEHKRMVDLAAEYYRAYGLDSIQGKDFAYLKKVWGDHPPEVGMVLSAVNDFWGSLVSSRRVPSFPGFDGSAEDEVTGKMLSQLINVGRRWAHSDDTEEQSVMDQILVGLGFAEDALETRGRPPFRPLDEYRSISDVWWDVSANLKCLRDGQYWIVQHHYSVDEAVARYPEHADKIKAAGLRQGAGSSPGAGAVEGGQSLGGKVTTVRLYGSDGQPIASETSRLGREVRVHVFQFLHFESLMFWDGKEAREEEFVQAMKLLEEEAAARGESFQRPAAIPYAQGTWYRAEILAEGLSGEPLVLSAAEPIPGNQSLAKCLTGFPERYKAEGSDRIRTRWFGFGKALLGLQRLASVTVRVGLEQEARRNRSSGAIDEGAFAENPEALQRFIEARAVPGALPVIPDGAWDKIHLEQPMNGSHVPAMQQMFSFLAVDLPGHMIGRSDMTRGTFTGDRSTKFLSTMQAAANQLNQILSAAFTAFLEKGAMTMTRLMLNGLDAEDIDRLLGKQRLWEGITGVRDQQGNLVPKPITGPDGQPIAGPDGQPLTMTMGRYLKENVGEIFDNDISFALRPSAASQRIADQELLTQHGIIKDLLGVAPAEIIVPAYLKLFAEGTAMFEAAADLDTYYAQQKQQQEEAAQAASEQGVVQFFQKLAKDDFEKAMQLIQQASEAVTGPQQGGGQPQIQ